MQQVAIHSSLPFVPRNLKVVKLDIFGFGLEPRVRDWRYSKIGREVFLARSFA